MRIAFVLPIALAAGACSNKAGPEPPGITEKWTDDFERAVPGKDWHATSQDAYRVSDGALNARGAVNHPLWLRKKLPRDATIEFDTWSNSDAGDIKVEAWGDGTSHAKDRGQYTSSGYVFVMGGWGNSKSILAKGNEHGKDVVQRVQPKVVVGQKYHWKIVRKGGRVEWFVDDMTTPFLAFDDPQPLEGAGHEYFAINNWESDLWFDNLVITPL
jgi:hypothetical protein